MDKAFKTEAIVLTKRNWREQDLLFSFFTKEYGKVEAVVVGARKIKSKLVGPLSSLGICEIVFVKGKAVNKITHAYIVDRWELKTVEEYYALSAIKEIVVKFLPLGVPSFLLWEVLQWFHSEVNKSNDVNVNKLLVNLFIIKVLFVLGYDFKTDFCVQCGQELKQVRRFSFSNKGFVCSNCRGGEINVSQRCFEITKKIQHEDLLQCISLGKNSNNELFLFLKRYLRYYLEAEVKSLELL